MDNKHNHWFWRQKAKRWLVQNNIINGFNGKSGIEQEELVESLAKTMFNIWNKPSP